MSLRVLLADDHAILREGLRALLKAAGDITVEGDASDGREAVRQAKQAAPDLVIMDIAMPNLNGIEATRQIRQSCPGTKVVILSMYGSPERIFQALRAGARGYLLKESVSKEVIAAVHSVHAGRRYLCHRAIDIVLDDFLQQRLATQQTTPLERLSSSEREVLQLIVEGKPNTAIANILHLSIKSVETYRSRLMHKLGIKDVPSLVKFAIQHGLTSL